MNDPSIAVVSSNGNDKLDAKCASNIGVYPKPMLDRIEPSVKALITHVSERTGYEEPTVPEPITETETEAEASAESNEEVAP